jgi:hypothetical protein
VAVGGSSSDTTGPVLADASPVVVDKAAKTITVSFNENIATKTDANITVYYDEVGGSVADATLTLTTDYTLAITAGKLVITIVKASAITSNALETGDVYKVAFAANAVADTAGNGNLVIGKTATDPAAIGSLDDDLVGLGTTSDSDYGF